VVLQSSKRLLSHCLLRVVVSDASDALEVILRVIATGHSGNNLLWPLRFWHKCLKVSSEGLGRYKTPTVIVSDLHRQYSVLNTVLRLMVWPNRRLSS
jgi:hypothetical protein